VAGEIDLRGEAPCALLSHSFHIWHQTNPIMCGRLIQALVAAVALGSLSGPLLANGLRLADQDAFATARGEAFVATADNPSAVYYNPAGLTQTPGANVRAGCYGIYFDPSYSPPPTAPNRDNTYHIDNRLAAVPQFFCSYAAEGSPLAFGLGVYSPFGGDLRWPQDTGFRTVGIEGSLTYARISPAVALQLGPTVSIGAGLSANYAKIEMEQGLRPNQRLGPNFFRFTGDGWSAGYNLGLLWQPVKQLSAGLTFRSTTSFTLRGQTEFQQPPIIPLGQSPAQAGYTFPLGAVIGLSYRPTPKWNLEFDADFTDWSSFDTITIVQTKPPFGGKEINPMPFNWQPSWMYEFGATRYLGRGWHVSAGYVFNENSVPDATYSPLVPDLNRHFFSIGAGVKAKRFSFDIAYQFGFGPDRTVTGSVPPTLAGQAAGQSADGTYDFISHAVLVTVGMRL
jgi:long-chain fatty acid transport protein